MSYGLGQVDYSISIKCLRVHVELLQTGRPIGSSQEALAIRDGLVRVAADTTEPEAA
jgi:hypothetical protein